MPYQKSDSYIVSFDYEGILSDRDPNQHYTAQQQCDILEANYQNYTPLSLAILKALARMKDKSFSEKFLSYADHYLGRKFLPSESIGPKQKLGVAFGSTIGSCVGMNLVTISTILNTAPNSHLPVTHFIAPIIGGGIIGACSGTASTYLTLRIIEKSLATLKNTYNTWRLLKEIKLFKNQEFQDLIQQELTYPGRYFAYNLYNRKQVEYLKHVLKKMRHL